MGVIVHEFEVDVVGQEPGPVAGSPNEVPNQPKLGTDRLRQILIRMAERDQRVRAD